MLASASVLLRALVRSLALMPPCYPRPLPVFLFDLQQLPLDAPVLILLPGLTGGSEDTYVQYAVVHAREAGIRAVVFNGRGTSDSPITTPQFYSASFTGVSVCLLQVCWPEQKACTGMLARVCFFLRSLLLSEGSPGGVFRVFF